MERESGEEYFIIEDQCPNREVEAQLAIPDEEEIRFAFKAFSFTKRNGKNITISCKIQECSIEDPSNPCEVSPQC
jgi:nitrite reductase/ring-hydroxylating ferredoxin subunit